MKIPHLPAAARRQREDGVVAVIVMLMLLALVLGFICANLHALSDLRGELKRVEQKQIRRLGYAATNSAPPSPAATNLSARVQPAPASPQ
jgi:hypothetical protein